MTLRLEDDRPIATTPQAIRIVARVVLVQGKERGLLGFGSADNHLHAELVTRREHAGAFARYVETALRWHLGLRAPFARARIRPLQDQRHAYNTFHYVQRQDERHALGLDPAREGTSLHDLLGLRVLDPSLAARVRSELPRVHREEPLAHFPPGLLDDDVESPIRLEVLADAAAAALTLPDVRGRGGEVTRARRAAVHAAGPAVPSEALADCLAIGVRSVQALRALPSERPLVRAVVRQARLKVALAARTGA